MSSFSAKSILVSLTLLVFNYHGWTQIDELSALIDDQSHNNKEFETSTFKSSRIINNNSMENTAKGTLDFRIAHRFSPVSGGVHDFFGLDGASMRLGFDYGISNFLVVGVGWVFRSKLNSVFRFKLYRAFRSKVNTLFSV